MSERQELTELLGQTEPVEPTEPVGLLPPRCPRPTLLEISRKAEQDTDRIMEKASETARRITERTERDLDRLVPK